jgi:hypothetical protein
MSALPELFNPLRGLFSYDAKKLDGSFVAFRLTATLDQKAEEFRFWIYMCSWWINVAEVELANSESSDYEITSAISMLNGRKFEDLVLHSPATPKGVLHCASLIFDGNLTIKLCQYEDAASDDAIFMMRNTEKMWVSYLSNGRIYVKDLLQ